MNVEILRKLEDQFSLVVIDLYGEGKLEDQLYVLCNADEHSKSDIEHLFEEYEEGYENDEIDCVFTEFLADKGVNFWILNHREEN